jgi:hypothetical protein
MSYIYGAPCKARNFNVVDIYTYIFLQFNKLAGEMVALLDAAITSAILDLISRVTLASFVTVQPR